MAQFARIGGPAGTAGVSGGVKHDSGTMTLDGKLWAHVGGNPGMFGATNDLDCNSAVRSKLCAAVDRAPYVNPPGR